MAQHKSAEKRIRANDRRAKRNVTDKSTMKTLLKKVRTTQTKDTASSVLKETISFLDKLAGKKVIHANKAANLKSKLTKYVNKLK
ncbi:MAG: 30S ribosomal protein S20 [Bacteriovoracaceae bacterium]|nr:30S ribosomal protein S20 [Bacteroidota bacterium]